MNLPNFNLCASHTKIARCASMFWLSIQSICSQAVPWNAGNGTKDAKCYEKDQKHGMKIAAHYPNNVDQKGRAGREILQESVFQPRMPPNLGRQDNQLNHRTDGSSTCKLEYADLSVKKADSRPDTAAPSSMLEAPISSHPKSHKRSKMPNFALSKR